VSTLTIPDTDILIGAAQRIGQALDCLNRIEQQSGLAISIITQMGLFVGCRDKTEQENTERCLQRFQVLKLDVQISGLAVSLLRQYRLSDGLRIPHTLIAATAIAWNHPLISKNQRDYRFIRKLQLLPYP
jgi:predicted nucleic acid-binding protein